MKRGAVAVLDALGFKGIWKRYDPARVLASLKLSSVAAQGQTNFLNKMFAEEKMRVKADIVAFSDTVFLIATADDEGGPLEGVDDLMAVTAVCGGAATLSLFAALMDPPILYRGAVTVGAFASIERTFLVGQAIDDAASLEKEPEGAIIMVDPSAIPRPPLPRASFVIKDYDVPIKGGRVLTTDVVNPFSGARAIEHLDFVKNAARRHGLVEGTPVNDIIAHCYNAAFGENRSLDVEIKRQNTQRLLLAARAQAELPAAESAEE